MGTINVDTIKNNVNLKNQLFKNVNVENEDQLKDVIEQLKTIYEDIKFKNHELYL